MDDSCSGKSFSIPRYPKSNTLTTCFGVIRMILFINIIVMSSSFLMVCFMDDKATIVNHKLCLYSMSFLLSRIEYLSFFLLSVGLGICCSVESIKARKPGKYFSTSSGVFKPFCYVVYLLWNW